MPEAKPRAICSSGSGAAGRNWCEQPGGIGVSELLALGVSHKTAPLELRERVALTEGRATGGLNELIQAPEIHEAAAISTCNRTELYLAATDAVGAESLGLSLLAREAGTPPTELVG